MGSGNIIFGNVHISFEVTIIPHTLKLTNLVKLKSKDIVNVEFDMIGKYLNKIYN